MQWASSKSVAEAVLSRRPGVLAVNANPVSQTATITYDADRTSVAELARWVRDCGYHCARRFVPDHLCDPMAEPGPPLPARINNHGAAERAGFVTGSARGRGGGGGGGAHGAGQHRTPQDVMGHGGHHGGMSMDARSGNMRNRFMGTAVLGGRTSRSRAPAAVAFRPTTRWSFHHLREAKG